MIFCGKAGIHSMYIVLHDCCILVLQLYVYMKLHIVSSVPCSWPVPASELIHCKVGRAVVSHYLHMLLMKFVHWLEKYVPSLMPSCPCQKYNPQHKSDHP